MKVRTIFMGTPAFAVPSLEALAALPDIEVVTVVTQPDRRAGRGKTLHPSAVKQRAEALGLPVWTPSSLRGEAPLARLHDLRPELLVVAAYGEILRPTVLELPPHGALNVHASLLPRHRGAAPVAGALLAGDRASGVTIMKMDEGMDTGPLLTQRAIPIRPDHTRGTLTAELAQLGAALLAETVPLWLAGDLTPQPQVAEDATYTRPIRKVDGELDWTRPAVELARRVRAFDPWPGTFTQWQGERLKVLAAHPRQGTHSAGPGTVAALDGGLAVATGAGWLCLDALQRAGRRAQDSATFLNGHPEIVGATLGRGRNE